MLVIEKKITLVHYLHSLGVHVNSCLPMQMAYHFSSDGTSKMIYPLDTHFFFRIMKVFKRQPTNHMKQVIWGGNKKSTCFYLICSYLFFENTVDSRLMKPGTPPYLHDYLLKSIWLSLRLENLSIET